MQDDEFDLLVFRGKELLLFNTYPYKNADGFLYFVMAVAEELSLTPEAFSVVFFGKYARYKKCYEALEHYHQKIIFPINLALLCLTKRNTLPPTSSIFLTDANHFRCS